MTAARHNMAHHYKVDELIEVHTEICKVLIHDLLAEDEVTTEVVDNVVQAIKSDIPPEKIEESLGLRRYVVELCNLTDREIPEWA